MTQGAEVICVGTELLLGEILNSNAQFLALELAKLGIPHFFQTVVGDNPVRIKQAIALACQRSSLMIFTGGLGPTPDDLTTRRSPIFLRRPSSKTPSSGPKLNKNIQHAALSPAPVTANRHSAPKVQRPYPTRPVPHQGLSGNPALA